MVIGNFALLAGLHPDDVDEWYLIVYADAYQWVEMPNVRGMALHADGGVMGSKPYAASGAYINRMSDYCRGCHYDVRDATGERGCPFNALYWDFIARHRDRFAQNNAHGDAGSHAGPDGPEPRLAAIREPGGRVPGAHGCRGAGLMDVLHAQALQARAAGEHERAIAAWRALLRQHPDDWRLALELKRDLQGRPALSGFRPAVPPRRPVPAGCGVAGALPRAVRFHGEDLEWLDARARAMLRAAPGDHRLHAIRGEVASQRRDWRGAEAAFAARLRARAGQRRICAASATPQGCISGSPPLLGAEEAAPGQSADRHTPIAFVNLDRNPERAAEIGRQFAGCAPPLHRVAGIEGGRLTAAAVRRLGGDPGMRGTLGCFLSHAAAWEAMLDRGDEHCLIVEDDVIPLLDLPASLDRARPARRVRPLLRQRPHRPPARPGHGVNGFTVAHRSRDAMQAFHPEDNAPGGDGYLLSRAGARKLLDWVAAGRVRRGRRLAPDRLRADARPRSPPCPGPAMPAPGSSASPGMVGRPDRLARLRPASAADPHRRRQQRPRGREPAAPRLDRLSARSGV